jgi:hypothetical protein
VVLRPKRDESVLITPDNLFDELLAESKYSRQSVGAHFLSTIFAIAGLSDRGIKGIKGMGLSKTVKLLDKLIESGAVLNQYYPRIETLLEDVRVKDKDTIIENFYKIDTRYGVQNLSKSDIIKLKDCIVDRFSKKDLQMLNVKYYIGFDSLMLEELMLEPRSNKEIGW